MHPELKKDKILIYTDDQPPKSQEAVQIAAITEKVPEALAALAKEQAVAKELIRNLKIKDEEKKQKDLIALAAEKQKQDKLKEEIKKA